MRSCEFRGRTDGCGHVFCERGRFWTSCTTPFCGEEPPCPFEPIDNGPEACQRRLEWLRAHPRVANGVELPIRSAEGPSEASDGAALAMNVQASQMALPI